LDYVFATTQDLAYQLINLGYDKTKIFHLPNMIDLNSVKTTTDNPETKFRDPPVIGTIGRFVKKKGFDIFINTLSILKDEGIEFKVIIAGDGEEKTKLEELTTNLKLKELISFPGWIKDKKKFFSSIDIFCLPSIHEPFGIVLLEALLYNKPIVSFKSEGPSEIGTDNQNMLFAKLGDARDLAEKIKLLINNQQLSSKLAKAGKSLIKEQYSLDVIQKLLDKYIKQIYQNITLNVDN
ncbi:MAG: glycosyltransferase family 4 protein, partial [Pseudomonadota bacterium]